MQAIDSSYGASYAADPFGFYGTGVGAPRMYQATPPDPQRPTNQLKDKEDSLSTPSNPQVAWKQLDELGLQMFMHLYCRNMRRLLACHVKAVVELFAQNVDELADCGVLVDVLLRRLPSQAVLCPPGQNQQLTNVSLADMLQNLTRNPLFVSKTRGVCLFDEHLSVCVNPLGPMSSFFLWGLIYPLKM